MTRHRDDLDFILAHRARRKKRSARLRRRQRAGIAAILLVLIAVGAARVDRRRHRVLGGVRPERATAGRDRPELVRLRRRRVAARHDSRRAQPRAGADVGDDAVARQGDGRDRGPALLPARRGRLPRHRASRLDGRDGRQGRAGRLDDHAAARAQPLYGPGADVQPQGQGGLSRDQALAEMVEGEDPQRLPEHRLLRQSRVRRGGRGADVLLRAREGPDAPPGRADRQACRRRRRSTTRCTIPQAALQRRDEVLQAMLRAQVDHAGRVPPGDPGRARSI